MDINLEDFWNSYLTKTEVNRLALLNNNIAGPSFVDNAMVISQNYSEQHKIFNASINKSTNEIEMYIHDTETNKDDIVVRGEMYNKKLVSHLNEINCDKEYNMSAEPIIITIKMKKHLIMNFIENQFLNTMKYH